MMSITAYILGVVVTSLIYSKHKDKGLDTRLSIYEDIIARLTAEVNVMNLRLSQINDNVISHREDHKVSNYKEEDIEPDRNKDDVNKNGAMDTVSNGTTLPILNNISGTERRKNGSMTQILDILAEGPKTSREIERIIGRSREHTARLMKHLYELGYVRRDESTRPYVYMLARRDNSTNI